jgi:hypothetical protein
MNRSIKKLMVMNFNTLFFLLASQQPNPHSKHFSTIPKKASPHIKGTSKNADFFGRARKHRTPNRSLHAVNEDASTEMTQLSQKKTVFRDALN